MKKHLGILLLAPALFLASCDDDDDDDDKGPVEEVQDTATNLLQNSDIVGSWTAGCAAFDGFGEVLDVSAKETMTFGGNNLTRTYALYEDAACQNQIGELRYEGNYELEEDGQNRDNFAEINSTIKNVKVTPNSEFLVKAYNTISWCGISDWSVGNTVEVTNTVGQGACQLPVNIGATSYGLVYAENDTMYLATSPTTAPTTEENRPTEVNRDITFNRQ